MRVLVAAALAAVAFAALGEGLMSPCYREKSRQVWRCMERQDVERRARCIERAEARLERCLRAAEPPATRPDLRALPDPQALPRPKTHARERLTPDGRPAA